MGKSSKYGEIVRNKLSERFNALVQYGLGEVDENQSNLVFAPGVEFDIISQRMLWYICVGEFKKTYGTDQIDIAGVQMKQHIKHDGMIQGFCERMIRENRERLTEIDPRLTGYWGILRKALGIEAKGRAVLYGVSGDEILITSKNREVYENKAFILVLCEKETLGKKWLIEMKRRRWTSINLVITQGFAVAELIEFLFDVSIQLKQNKTILWVGVLHDLDAAGQKILNDVAQWYDVLELGVSFEMLDQINPSLFDQLKEMHKLTSEDIAYFEKRNQVEFAKRLGQFRLELDNLYVSQGIEVFGDWAEKIIAEKCDTFDLNRMGVPDYREPHEYFSMWRTINDIWSLIIKTVTGIEDDELDLTDVAKERYEQIIQENIHYKASIDEIKRWRKILETQGRELQEIVDTNDRNKLWLDNMRVLVESLNLEKFYELINEIKNEGEYSPTELETRKGYARGRIRVEINGDYKLPEDVVYRADGNFVFLLEKKGNYYVIVKTLGGTNYISGKTIDVEIPDEYKQELKHLYEKESKEKEE